MEQEESKTSSHYTLARALTLLEAKTESKSSILKKLEKKQKHKTAAPVLGITGTGGAGKSSLLDELLLRFLEDFKDIQIGIVCVDPSKKKTGGALLGDRIRVNTCAKENIFLRSLASRGNGKELSSISKDASEILKSQNFDLIIVETSGIGQGDTGILDLCDHSLYVMTSEFGAASQLEKIDMLDFADFIAVNKYERRQAPDAIRDIQATLRRSRY